MQMLAVVPIFVSAGAAVLPTILAAGASVAAVALKPRELMRLVRSRPRAAGATLGVLLLAGFLTFLAVRPKAVAKAGAGVFHTDWAKVAEDILARRAAEGTAVISGGPASAPASHPTTAPGAPVFASDYSRAAYDGSPAPAGLKPLWRFRPADTMFLSMPVLAGKRIFVAGCQSDLGGYTGILACLNADSGAPVWQLTELNNQILKPFFSSPTFSSDGKYLLIGQGLHEDRDCSLLCLEAATGKLHWAVKTPLHIESSPAVFGDMAVVGAGAIEGGGGRPTGDPGYVFAVRISDGKPLWRYAVNDPESTPAVDKQGIVYIGSGFNGNGIVALRSEPDEELREKHLDRLVWRTAAALPVTGTMTLAGDLVIAGAGNGDFVHSQQNAQGLVIALDRKTGERRWQTLLEDAVLGSVAFRDNVLIVPCRTGEVLALAVDTGNILWRKRVSGSAPVLAGCAFTGSFVYAISSDGYLARMNGKDGSILEKVSLNGQANPGSGLSGCPPQIVNGRLIAGSETGGIQSFVGSEGAP